METTNETTITVACTVHAPISKVWEIWTSPEHIMNWNSASDDWHTTSAENELKIEGKFSFRMEAKDGSAAFDFWGIYTTVVIHQQLAYTLGDNRKVSISFAEQDGQTTVTEIFEPEQENSIELQQLGWQAIMDSFKTYTEAL